MDEAKQKALWAWIEKTAKRKRKSLRELSRALGYAPNTLSSMTAPGRAGIREHHLADLAMFLGVEEIPVKEIYEAAGLPWEPLEN